MNSNVPYCRQSTDVSYARKYQIDTVKVFNDNVSEISPNEEYSVEFIAGENKLAMLIILGSDFPMEKPLLKITPSISHRWVNENSEIVSAPGYLNFSVHSDLGRVVHVIIRELQRNPPTMKQRESPLAYMSRLKPDDNTETPSSSEEYEQSFEVMSSVVSRLHKMSINELWNLNENNDSLDSFVDELPHIRSMKQAFIDMINATEELEGKKTDVEFKIEENRPEFNEKQRELNVCKANCKLLYNKYEKLMDIRSPVNVKKRLKRSAALADAESETIAENFLDAKISLDEFLSRYKVLRMKLHEIKVKEERINRDLRLKDKLT